MALVPGVSEHAQRFSCGDVLQAAAFPEVETTPCEVCHLRNEHTKDVAVPEAGLEGVCAKYSANSCCGTEIATEIQESIGSTYGPEYRWDKCYFYHSSLNETLASNSTLSAKCASL